MPTYQCPTCHDLLVVDEADDAAVECPRCRPVATDGWYVRVGGREIGPLPEEAIRELAETGVQVRRNDDEFSAIDTREEFVVDQPDDEDAIESPPRSNGGFARVLLPLLLVAAAISGWVYHFANRNSAPREASKDIVANDRRSSREKTGTQPRPVARKPVDVAGRKKPAALPDIQPEDVNLEIKPLSGKPKQVVVSVTIPHAATWKYLKATSTEKQLNDALSFRLLGKRELRMKTHGRGQRRKRLLRRVNRPPNMLGEITVAGKSLQFKPYAPLLKGEVYIAKFDPARLGLDTGLPQASFEKQYVVGPRRPRLEAIHPQAKALPVNVARIHLAFTEPMQREDAADRIRLQSADNDKTDLRFPDAAFRWSKDGRVCTIQVIGKSGWEKSPFKVDVRYRLTVSGEWKSTAGLPLVDDGKKLFVAVAEDSSGPVPTDWSINFPKSAGKQIGIRCKMGESLDWLSWRNALRIVDGKGRQIPGRFAFILSNSGWTFRPDAPWDGGDYKLLISSELRDLAGQAVQGKLQTDETDPKRKWIAIPFHIKGGRK